VVECPIYREKNGLAMSSRNERLSPEAREKASIIYKTLQNIKENFNQKSIEKHHNFVAETFKKHTDFTLEYFEIADEKTLKPGKHKRKNKKFRAFIAVWIEDVRLIDTLGLI
jgi:pantoate--beta-alanine ligase